TENDSAFARHALPHVVTQPRLRHPFRLTFLAAIEPLGQLRHLSGEAVVDVLPAIGAFQALCLGLVPAGVTGGTGLLTQSLPARVWRSWCGSIGGRCSRSAGSHRRRRRGVARGYHGRRGSRLCVRSAKERTRGCKSSNCKGENNA